MLTKTRHFWRTRLVLILILVIGIIGGMPAKPVHASSLMVTNANDSGMGSLRQTILNAAAGDTITFDPSLAGQAIALSTQLTINKDLIINGSGLTPRVVLSGEFASQIMQITFLATNVTISDLTFTRGFSTGQGGAIYMNGNTQLTVNNSTFFLNEASSSGGAIAIQGNGSITVNHTAFYQNVATSTGGAISIQGFGPITVIDSRFTENHATGAGGGIFASAAALTLVDSTLSRNTAGDDGGAIYGSSLTIQNTTLDRNQATLDGGALKVTGNGSSTIVNSTIFQNQAGDQGGAINSLGNVSIGIFNSTFAANNAAEGKEVMLTGTTSLDLHNTIVVCTTGSDNCYTSFQAAAILTDHSILAVGALHDYGLAALADNGGPTQTLALLPESPLLDAGDDAVCSNAQVDYLDQRGVARPQGSHCDIGAYERQFRVRYVRQDAAGANDGTSWVDAYTDLQSALSAASGDDEIWVAAGVYKPTAGTDRAISFTLKNGVALYGGFTGTEASRVQRNPATNLTVLSGDIGVAGNNSDNSYHVIVGSNINNSAILDGFTVTGGNADGGGEYSNGGGLYTYLGGPSLTNLTFIENSALMLGGGMYNGGIFMGPEGSNPILSNVIFQENTALEGAGMLNENHSDVILTNVIFKDNIATRASGGLENRSSATLTNVTFDGNVGGIGPGGMGNFAGNASLTNVTFRGNSATFYGGGAVNAHGNQTFTNVTFHENSAAYGGGMWNSFTNPSLTNVTLSGNSATTSGGGIYSEKNLNTIVRNTILWGNTAPAGAQIYSEVDVGVFTVSDSVVQDGFAGGTNIITTDPRLGLLSNHGGFTETIPLQAGSSAMDTANDTYCPTADQRGVTRPQGTHCDIGAYEYEKKSGNDTTGVFRPSNGLLYLKNSNDTGFADMALNYGLPGDDPVVGDWDGNGTVTIGVYRDGYFYLRNSNTIGFAEIVFPFGQAGDQPIAGDWNGDSLDTIGVFRPSNGQFFLRDSNTEGPAEMSFYLGNPGDVGVAGDWNGDGKDTTGVFRPSNGLIYLKDQNTSGFADMALNYGLPGDKPVTGDWNNDGVDTIGVYREGLFYLRNSNTIGFAELIFGLGNPGDMPIAGDWDGLP